MKVVALEKPDPKSDLIRLLERLMQDAKDGSLQDLCYVGLMHDGSVLSGGTPTKDRVKQLGSLAVLQYKLVRQMLESENGQGT